MPFLAAPQSRLFVVIRFAAKSSWLPLLLLHLFWFSSTRADIFEWEDNGAGGRRESTTLVPDGAGIRAVPYARLQGLDLTKAWLVGKDLTGATLGSTNLENADLTDAEIRGITGGAVLISQQQLYSTASYKAKDLSGTRLSLREPANWDFRGVNLTNSRLSRARLTNADLTGAEIRGADLRGAVSSIRDQFYETASYQAGNLTGVRLWGNNLSGWNFDGQDLTNAVLQDASLTNTTFNNAIIRGTNFRGATNRGFTLAQLYSTANYQQKDLTDVILRFNDLTNADFAGFNLTDVNFRDATLVGVNFTAANITGADFAKTMSRGFTKQQLQSTSSYQRKNLTGVGLTSADLSNYDFSNFILNDAVFSSATLSNTNLTGAQVQGADFSFTTSRGFTEQQFYSTASYQNKNLTGIRLSANDLTGWDLSAQNLTNAIIRGSNLANTNFTGAEIEGARFDGTTNFTPNIGFTSQQLYSTASYQSNNLTRVSLESNDLTGWDFSGQDLTNASFSESTLSGTNFSGAIIRGANLDGMTGFTEQQLYSTASYQTQDLRGIDIFNNDLTNWDFSGQNLTGSRMQGSILLSTDFAGADLRGALYDNLTDSIVSNTIEYDGYIVGVDLTSTGGLSTLAFAQASAAVEPPTVGETLTIRNYDGNTAKITVDDQFVMDSTGTLAIRLDDFAWNSEIGFEPGIPVILADGTLSIEFEAGVDIASRVGDTFDLFDWSGVSPSGEFTIVSSQPWDLSKLYTTGEITLVPEPGSVALLLLASAMVCGCIHKKRSSSIP